MRDKLARDTLPVKLPIALEKIGSHLLSAHPLSPSFLPPRMDDMWKTPAALGTEWVLNMWVVCTANGLFALADIPVETDMLLSLIQSLVVDPENERLVRKMSHKPAVSGNQQVRKASQHRSGNSAVLTRSRECVPCLITVHRQATRARQQPLHSVFA